MQSKVFEKRRGQIDKHRFVVSICGVYRVAAPSANIVNVNEARLPVLIYVKNGEGLDTCLVEDH